MPNTALSENVLFASVRELGDKIRVRELSPVALTEAYLDRLQKIGPKLGAVVNIPREQALEEAAAAEKEIRAGKIRGPLHGVPYGLKDLVATKGIPTTWGAEPYKNRVLDYDGTVVKKLREAGAILVAKLAMIELAGAFGYNNADSCFTGPTVTPWNTEYWAGGSSSGPGAATAAGLVGFSIGSETSGSIVTPAAYCGVSGLRPTYGRVSRHGAMALSWTLDKLGPMCRSADCCGLVLAAIAGKDPQDRTSLDKPFAYPEPARKEKFRIGVIKDCTKGIMPAVKENFERSVKALADFCDIEDDVPLPDLPFGFAVGVIVRAEGASAFQDLIRNGRIRELKSDMTWSGYAASMTTAVDYLQAMRTRTKMRQALEALYKKYDALIAPGRTATAESIRVDFDQSNRQYGGGPQIIQAGNIAGQPAICVPNGFGPNNLPTSIQFTGRAWSEGRLLAIAAAYQKATDWHTRRPTV